MVMLKIKLKEDVKLVKARPPHKSPSAAALGPVIATLLGLSRVPAGAEETESVKKELEFADDDGDWSPKKRSHKEHNKSMCIPPDNGDN